jgi:hypothetical protein
MHNKLLEKLQEELKESQNFDDVRSKLLTQGFLENDVDEAITQASKEILSQKKNPESHEVRTAVAKSFLDRMGFGFGSPQFLSILLQQVGASLFLVGIINGIRAIVSVFINSCIQEFQRQKELVGTRLSEILMALGFIVLILGYKYHSMLIFISGMFIITIFFAYYNDVFNGVFKKVLQENRKDSLTGRLTHLGLITTAICLLIGAFFLEKSPASGYFLRFSLFEKEHVIQLQGYAIVLGAAALFFILSGLMLARAKPAESDKNIKACKAIRSCLAGFRSNISILFRNKIILTLIITSAITGFIQTLGNSFYGIYIYENFFAVGFGGFLNVAVIFIIALMTSIIAPLITRKNAIEYGKFPMLVFGTMLMAIMPLSFYYKPNLISIAMGTILGVIGGAITGVAQGLLTLDLISDYERKIYYESVSMFSVIPMLIAIPIGSLVAQVYGLKTLFLGLSLMLAGIVVPLYFIVVVLNNKKEKI